MNRRSYLSVSLTLLIPLVSGCSERLSDDQEQETSGQRDYRLGVYNESRDTHSFTVRIGDSPDGYFHEESLELEGETANEDIKFDGIPARLFVTIGSEEEQEFPWPVSYSGSDEASLKANIYYDPTRDQEILIYA
ncbi:hypothetical protein [Halalkalicoccus paucihalophilus]|uniref:hypothetical protein n=1 Tax=Halalkalicoccus paucihalophilus TaxID=1008153 RepID=UPI0012ED036A|nr:hypothetical protein [Halalkalicoccus paucihalophilus]